MDACQGHNKRKDFLIDLKSLRRLIFSNTLPWNFLLVDEIANHHNKKNWEDIILAYRGWYQHQGMLIIC